MSETSFESSVTDLFKNEYKSEQSVTLTEKKNILFEILNALFTNKAYIDMITPETAKQNIFMINRRLAIKYPLHAQAFNQTGMNPMGVLLAWSTFLYSGNVPQWLYTPGTAKTKAAKDNIFTDNVIKKFTSYYNISSRDMKSCMRLFPKETEDEIKAFIKFQKELAKNEEFDN